jgi:hypothetical protein
MQHMMVTVATTSPCPALVQEGALGMLPSLEHVADKEEIFLAPHWTAPRQPAASAMLHCTTRSLA